MTAKTVEITVQTSQVDQFSVVTSRLRLGTWPCTLCLSNFEITRQHVITS